jgi:hypothetical protein
MVNFSEFSWKTSEKLRQFPTVTVSQLTAHGKIHHAKTPRNPFSVMFNHHSSMETPFRKPPFTHSETAISHPFRGVLSKETDIYQYLHFHQFVPSDKI